MASVAPETHGRWPRLLKRPEAAAYAGVSVSKFDQMVSDGRMPQPKRIDTRKAWDKNALDAAIDDLPEGGADQDNPWDTVLT